ncbi:MAG: ABC transporter ATP-binding protein [Candidatus Delongbacteria bacterium]|nr:ABC transporter ATP-binding protein [Candidatus Delongbacteria bacterium]
MIRITNLLKTFGEIKAVDIASLAVNPGEITGLVGNNGAGKTTLFRLILDLYQADHGNVMSNQKDVAQSEDWKHYTGSFLDQNFLIGFLTPEEYFEFIAHLHHLSIDDLQGFHDRFQPFFNGEINGKKKLIRDYSLGNQIKIGIAAAMMFNPDVLILDEPFAHLDPSGQILFKRMLKQFDPNQSKTIFLSSHNLNHITDICDRIILIDHGQVIDDIRTSGETIRRLEDYFIGQTG